MVAELEKGETSVSILGVSEEEEAEKQKSKHISQRYKDYFIYQVLVPLALLAIAAALLGLGWFLCPICVVCVFLFSACTCAYMPIMNVPLWISIVILMWQGWKISDGALSLTWK